MQDLDEVPEYEKDYNQFQQQLQKKLKEATDEQLYKMFQPLLVVENTTESDVYNTLEEIEIDLLDYYNWPSQLNPVTVASILDKLQATISAGKYIQDGTK